MRVTIGKEVKYMDDLSIEELDDAWFWQLILGEKNLPQLCLPRNRYG